jgi:hypothetical protein
MLKRVEGFPGWLLLLSGHILVAVLGYIDYLTGDYSILVFYLVPIFIIAWLQGGRRAVFVSVAAGLARVLSDYYGYYDTPFMYWDSLLDMGFLLTAGLLIALLKRLLVEEQERITEIS